jgi:protein-S-isoprenylcysteine O-methyltransferase Ste14
MIRRDSKLLILILLAVAFTLSLTFVTLEIPYVINDVLRAHFPDIIQWAEPARVEEFLSNVRPIGYACLGVVLSLIVVGFIKGKKSLSSMGSIAFFIPTFGYFAASMFFLAGAGVLRALWMPFLDSSIDLLKLGDVVYLPYMVIAYPFRLIGVDIGASISTLAIGLGIFVFILGTITWFYGKFEKRKIFDFWIYKYSRHPQYLGFLIWSYGVMLFASLSPVPFGGINPGASFPWLITSLAVICVALREEIKMVKLYGESYSRYRESSPFMLPLPKFISSAVTAPIRILFKSNLPKNGKEIVSTFAVYIIIFILLSLPFLLL